LGVQGNRALFTVTTPDSAKFGSWAIVAEGLQLRNASSPCASDDDINWDIAVLATWTAPNANTTCPRDASGDATVTVGRQAELQRIWQYGSTASGACAPAGRRSDVGSGPRVRTVPRADRCTTIAADVAIGAGVDVATAFHPTTTINGALQLGENVTASHFNVRCGSVPLRPADVQR